MSFTNFIRGIVKNNSWLKNSLKQANSKLTPFQYVYQTLTLTVFSFVGLLIIGFLIFKKFLMLYGFFILISIFMSFFIYRFWLEVIKVQIRKYGREVTGDLLFVSEYFLVTLESGIPLGNAIQRLSNIDRPGGRFFKRVYIDFRTGKSLENALDEASVYSPTTEMKTFLKKLKDSLVIGVDLRNVLENFIEEASAKKIMDIKSFSKKLNPIIMMYLLLGIVLPSLGVTFFILGASMLNVEPVFLRLILIFIFLMMFVFQYISYTSFKFSRSTI